MAERSRGNRHNLDAAEVAQLLPEIMQRLAGKQSPPAGIRELTIAQARALRAIARTDTSTMGELAGGLHITLGAATGLVDRLIQHGLVERGADPQDRRVVRVRLTSLGRRTHASVVRETRRRLGLALSRLSSEQQAAVVEGLAILRDALSEASD